MTIPNHVNTATDAYYYARDVIKGRWEEGESIIATDPWNAYNYAFEIIKGRWLEGEAIIATDHWNATRYDRFLKSISNND